MWKYYHIIIIISNTLGVIQKVYLTELLSILAMYVTSDSI